MSDPLIPDDEDDEPTAPFWMTTFSDMVTLLLTFFVLIVSMSEVEVKKFKEALSSFQGRQSFLMHDAVIPPVRNQQRTAEEKREQSQRYEELLSYLEESELQGKVEVNMTEEGMHVIITDSVMFRSGNAQLLDSSREVLSRIAGVITKVESVIVEGHTDDQPIATAQFPSNWELSSARAASVVRFLLSQETGLPPERYQAVGYGEHRPITTNETAAGRAQNRRVEILFSWEPWQNKTKNFSSQQTATE